MAKDTNMAHQWKRIHGYYINYNVEDKHIAVILLDKKNQFIDSLQDLGDSKAAFCLDMLRNEDPIYWHPERKLLSTSTEPVGEGE